MISDGEKRLYNSFLGITKGKSLFPRAAQLMEFIRQARAEANSISIERVKIFLKRLPADFNGIRIIHLSDIHHSPFTSLEYIKKVVEITNRLEPDLLLLTGDYVSHETKYIAPVAEALGNLSSKYGIYACLGNHDHWTNADLIIKEFSKTKIHLLINEGLHLRINNSEIWLCAVDDYMVGKSDIKAALMGAREEEFKLLLAHNPVLLRSAARHNIDLVLSGHTHGGQIRLKNERKLIPRRLKSGLYRYRPSYTDNEGDTQIYITRGIGTVVVPLRYQCPPEISILELCSTGSEASAASSKK
jgi:predicted MPP superfamily phosphohydrolase